jgi:2-dehydropantoate 2-reductase
VKKNKIKIVIVGPGSMGCLFACLLSDEGREIWLLDKDEARAKKLNDNGIILEREGKDTHFKINICADPTMPGKPDLVVLCVKAYDTDTASSYLSPLVSNDTDILSLQNGVGNAEILCDIFGEQRVLCGTTVLGANLKVPGHVIHAGEGETVIGQPDGGTDRSEKVIDIFRESNIDVRQSKNIESVIWSKLLINSAINPLTAILSVRNGVLPKLDGAKEVMKDSVSEAVTVCEKKGIELAFDNPYEEALSVCEATSKNISSMLSDVRAGKKTEINQINGAVYKEAQKLGVSAPVNKNLTNLVMAIEMGHKSKI